MNINPLSFPGVVVISVLSYGVVLSTVITFFTW